jgi:hypothetical protein
LQLCHLTQLQLASERMFARDITNSHSAEHAAHLLLDQQRDVPGSGRLADYLGDLPHETKIGD